MTRHKEPRSGPPLMRIWDNRYAAPCDRHATKLAAQDFQLLTAALAATQVRIPELNFHNNQWLDYPEAGGLNLSMANEIKEFSAGTYTYRYLTSFSLKVFVRGSDISQNNQDCELLPYLLGSMRSLKKLSIDIRSTEPIDDVEPPQLRGENTSIPSLQTSCHQNPAYQKS